MQVLDLSPFPLLFPQDKADQTLTQQCCRFVQFVAVEIVLTNASAAQTHANLHQDNFSGNACCNGMRLRNNLLNIVQLRKLFACCTCFLLLLQRIAQFS